MSTDVSATTVEQLRDRWKPHKDCFAAKGGVQPTAIRFHRACSWMAQVEKDPEGTDHDLGLISLWISLNSLYGQWDDQKKTPKPDRECWQAFVDTILQLDDSSYVADALSEHKRLVMTLLEDEYLSNFFWKEPSTKRAGQSKKAKYDAQGWYVEKRWVMILDQVLDRIYLMRCQLVHGAATYGGQLNRASLRRCVMMIQRLLPAFLMVWIDHGTDQDWGQMCYPPLRPGPVDARVANDPPRHPR